MKDRYLKQLKLDTQEMFTDKGVDINYYNNNMTNQIDMKIEFSIDYKDFKELLRDCPSNGILRLKELLDNYQDFKTTKHYLKEWALKSIEAKENLDDITDKLKNKGLLRKRIKCENCIELTELGFCKYFDVNLEYDPKSNGMRMLKHENCDK